VHIKRSLWKASTGLSSFDLLNYAWCTCAAGTTDAPTSNASARLLTWAVCRLACSILQAILPKVTEGRSHDERMACTPLRPSGCGCNGIPPPPYARSFVPQNQRRFRAGILARQYRVVQRSHRRGSHPHRHFLIRKLWFRNINQLQISCGQPLDDKVLETESVDDRLITLDRDQIDRHLEDLKSRQTRLIRIFRKLCCRARWNSPARPEIFLRSRCLSHRH